MRHTIICSSRGSSNFFVSQALLGDVDGIYYIRYNKSANSFFDNQNIPSLSSHRRYLLQHIHEYVICSLSIYTDSECVGYFRMKPINIKLPTSGPVVYFEPSVVINSKYRNLGLSKVLLQAAEIHVLDVYKCHAVILARAQIGNYPSINLFSSSGYIRHNIADKKYYHGIKCLIKQ